MIRRKTTKELISESFMELLEKEPLSKITIKKISDNCGVTPTTFYNHFNDKYDLIHWSYQNEETSFVHKINDSYTWYHAALDTLLKIKKDSIYYTKIMKNSELQNKLRSTTYASALYVIEQKYGKQALTKEIIYTLELYFYGVSAMTADWLKSGMKESPEYIIYQLIDSMPYKIMILLCPQWNSIKKDLCHY